MICGFCDEPIQHGELAPSQGDPLHVECLFRLLVGSVAHIQRRCGCFIPGSVESDPHYMTLRQAARAALRLHHVMQERN